MDQTNQQPVLTPTPSPTPTPMPNPMMPAQHENKPWGPVVGIVVIILLLVIAAVYVWGQKLNNDSKVVPATPVTQTQTTPSVTEQPKDEFSDMEANLNASVEGLDDANF